MATFEVFFSLCPPGWFGLPEQGKTVVPSGTGVAAPWIDMVTGTLEGTGTLPIYRQEDRALRAQFSLPKCQAKLVDDRLILTVPGDRDRPPIAEAMATADRFAMLLAALYGQYLSVRVDKASIKEDSKYRPIVVPKALRVLSLRAYDLERMSQCVARAGQACFLEDDALTRALAYFYHGLFLEQTMYDTDQTASIWPLLHLQALLSVGILTFFKAASTILGDPASDRDYQRRYRRYGVSRKLWEDFDKLYRLRSTRDVAHYTKEQIETEVAARDWAFAKVTTSEVLGVYISHLEKGQTAGPE